VKKERPPVFRPLPASFVFPSIEFMFFGIFSLGLTKTAVAALCSQDCRSMVFLHDMLPVSRCTATASAVLVVVGVFTSLSFALLVRFHCRFSIHLWSKAEAPDLGDVQDPLMRLVSRCRSSCRLSVLIDRTTGSFEKCEEDVSEPERTERLLKSPLKLLHSNAADAFDALSLFWLARSSSGGCLLTFYDFASFFCMLCLGVAYGMEEWAGTYGRQVEQSIAVISIQFGLCLYILLIRPSVDRLEGTISGIQLAVEGSATLALLLALVFPELQASLLETAFLLALAAVGIPMLTIIYDSILCPVINAITSVRSCSDLRTAVINFLYTIPGIVMNLMGYDSADLVDTVTSEASTRLTGGGAVRHHIYAAMTVQRLYRGHVARMKVREQRVLARQASASKGLIRVRTRILSCAEAAPVRIKKRIGACSGAIIPSACVDTAPVRTKTRVRSSADFSALPAGPCEEATRAAAPASADATPTRVKTRVRVCSGAEAPAAATALTRTKSRVRMSVEATAPTRTKTRIRVRTEEHTVGFTETFSNLFGVFKVRS